MKLLEVSIEKENIPILCFHERPKAILDQTVAKLYSTNTKHVKRAVSRNKEKFPSDFCFQLTEEEFAIIKNNNCFNLKYSYQLPYAFTHLGANMLANVLHSEVAIQRSLEIIRVFTSMEKNDYLHLGHSELRDHLSGIYHMIKILVDEIYTNRNKQKSMLKMIFWVRRKTSKTSYSSLGNSSKNHAYR